MLDMSRRQMMMRLGLTPATYSMWRPGKQQPGLDSLSMMARTWHVSLDSLMGRGARLEPSPDLKLAQEALATRLYNLGNDTGTPTERLHLCWCLLEELLPDLTVESWADWIRWTVEDWLLAENGQLVTSPLQLRAAAKWLGWYEGEAAWFDWLLTGRAEALQPLNSDAWKRLYLFAMGENLDVVDLMRLVQRHRLNAQSTPR